MLTQDYRKLNNTASQCLGNHHNAHLLHCMNKSGATPQDSTAAPSGIRTFQLGIAELFAQPGDIAQLSAEHIRDGWDKKVQAMFLYRATGALSPKGHAHSFVRRCYQSPRAPLALLSHRMTIRADPGPSGLEGTLQQPPPGNANKKRVEKIKSLLSLWPFV